MQESVLRVEALLLLLDGVQLLLGGGRSDAIATFNSKRALISAGLRYLRSISSRYGTGNRFQYSLR